jgi:hypothetical protein
MRAVMTDPSAETPNETDDNGMGQAASSPVKDPQDWATGDEPPTGPQLSYLSTLAREAGEEVPEDLTKASASERIDELQERTGRGQGS